MDKKPAAPVPSAEDPDPQPGTNGEVSDLELLLAEASPQTPVIAPELEPARKRAADSSLPLYERLEAYEDIFDSEVGDTNMTRARNVERQVGLRQLYVKFEGSNPTGTQKDRIAFAQAMDAMRRSYVAITAATCGNYGVAIALAAWSAGLRCLIYIPQRYHSHRLEEMRSRGAEIVTADGDYEAAVLASRRLAEERDDVYDANPGGANTAIQLKAYSQIALEIFDEMRDAPAIVAVPVSNGTTLAGIYRGFVSLYRRGKTSRIPRIVAGSSHGKNPIIHAVRRKSPSCEDLHPARIHETVTNEPLINWHSIDGEDALTAVRESNGWAAYASDKAMRQHSRIIRELEGLDVLPASTAGLIALLDPQHRAELPGDRYVIVLTGRRA